MGTWTAGQLGAPGWCSQVVARAGRPAGSKRLQMADEGPLFLCSWLRHRRQPLGKRQLPGCPPGWRQSFLLIPSMMRNRICFWSPCQSLLRTNHLKLDWLISFSSHQRSGWGCCSLFFVGWRFFLFLYPFCGRQLGQKELASGAPCFRQGVSAPSNLELVREGYLLQFDWLMVVFLPPSPLSFPQQGQEDWVSPSLASTWMRLDAFTILSKALKERSPRDSGGHPWPKSLPQGQSDLRIQSGAKGHQHQQDRFDYRCFISVLRISWGFSTLISRIPSGGDNV